MSGKRGPSSSAFGPMSGVRPVRLMWSLMTMSVPGPNDGSSPPAALVRTTIRRAEGVEQQDRLDDEPRVVALVEVEPALEHDDDPAAEATRAAAGRRGPAPWPPASRAARRTGSRPGPRARRRARRGRSPSTMPTSGTSDGPVAHRRDERGQAGGLIRRRDRPRSDRVDDRSGRTCGPPGTASRGRRPRPADFVRPTEVSTPGCRSRPVGRTPADGPW